MRLKSSKTREKSFENSLICDKFAIKKTEMENVTQLSIFNI